MALELLNVKNEETNNDDDDDWITGQAKLAEQQRKVYEINKMLKSLEEFNNNIEKIKKVGTLCLKNLFEKLTISNWQLIYLSPKHFLYLIMYQKCTIYY